MDHSGINWVEALFLVGAIAMTIPFVFLLKFILKELKKEHPEAE